MSDGIRILAAFGVALVGVRLATPLARRVAGQVRFYDHPVGYKRHLSATPYLGGAALMAGFLVAAGPLADGFSRYVWLTLCALALLAVGTLDDRRGLSITTRLGAEAAVATVLWAAGQGWDVLPGDGANLVLTIVWVVALVNGFNLMDNLDGAMPAVAGTCGIGIGALALSQDDPMLAAFCFALAGACAGFLPSNLAKPARIFLGDGGSMPVGLLVAGTIMIAPHDGLGWEAILVAAPLAALPILDTALVVVSRYRRGVAMMEGARDHLSHRLLSRLGSERWVALALAMGQGLMCGLAIALYHAGSAAIIVTASASVLAGVLVLSALEAESWGRTRLEPPG